MVIGITTIASTNWWQRAALHRYWPPKAGSLGDSCRMRGDGRVHLLAVPLAAPASTMTMPGLSEESTAIACSGVSDIGLKPERSAIFAMTIRLIGDFPTTRDLGEVQGLQFTRASIAVPVSLSGYAANNSHLAWHPVLTELSMSGCGAWVLIMLPLHPMSGIELGSKDKLLAVLSENPSIGSKIGAKGGRKKVETKTRAGGARVSVLVAIGRKVQPAVPCVTITGISRSPQLPFPPWWRAERTSSTETPASTAFITD
jgi:hypothetical protein